MRIYRVEDINKWYEQPKLVEAENTRHAIKLALGIENVVRDNSGNILVKANVVSDESPYARWQSWVYREKEKGE